jgi:hypothetical protein
MMSQFPVNIVCLVICLVCIFYTFVGGMKLVMWTDTFQVRKLQSLRPVGVRVPGGHRIPGHLLGVHLLHLNLAAGLKVTQRCRFRQGEIDKNCKEHSVLSTYTHGKVSLKFLQFL